MAKTFTSTSAVQRPFYHRADESSFFGSETSSLFDSEDTSFDTDASSIHSDDEYFTKHQAHSVSSMHGPTHTQRMPTPLLLPPRYQPPRYRFSAQLARGLLPIQIQRYIASFTIDPPTSSRAIRTAYINRQLRVFRAQLENELGMILEESTRAIVRLAAERRTLEKEMSCAVSAEFGSRPREKLEGRDEKQLERWRLETARHVRGAEILFTDRAEWIDEYVEKLDSLIWLELRHMAEQQVNGAKEACRTVNTTAKSRRSSVSVGSGHVERGQSVEGKRMHERIELRRKEISDMVARFDEGLVEDMRDELAKWNDTGR